MLTLFAIPKPFKGHVGVIQRNAITSWTLLRPACEVVLFGDEEGTARVARDLGVGHAAGIARNEYGTPVLNDVLEKAQRSARHDVLCFLNSDVILTGQLTRAAQYLSRRKRRFLMVGRRWDVAVTEALDFGAGWEARLWSLAASRGRLHAATGIDYFVFRRGTWRGVPPFAVGRPGYDNWMICRARAMGLAVVDATGVVTAVHQDHGYAHVPSPTGTAWEGPEADQNRELAGGRVNMFTLDDATHRLSERGLRADLRWKRLRRHLRTAPRLYVRPLIPAGLRKVLAGLAGGLSRVFRSPRSAVREGREA